MTPARSVALLQLAVGGALLRLPALALRAATAPDGRRPRAVVRVLGARHLVQGAVLLRHHDRADLLRGAAVDTLHSASCLLYARRLPAARRAAVLAAVLAGLQVAAALPRDRRAPALQLVPLAGGEEVVELRGGPMDGATVPVAAGISSYEVLDADHGRRRYDATDEVTPAGWRVFALPEDERPV